MGAKQLMSYWSVFAWLLNNLSLLFYVIAFSSPYWLEEYISDLRVMNIGIWRTCYLTTKSDNYDEVCADSKDTIVDDWSVGWVSGVQAMSTIGLVVQALAAALINMTTLAPAFTEQIAAVFVAMCADFSAATFTFMCLLVYGVRHTSDSYLSNTIIGWAYILCGMAALLQFISCILLFAEFVNLVDLRRRKPRLRRSRIAPLITQMTAPPETIVPPTCHALPVG